MASADQFQFGCKLQKAVISISRCASIRLGLADAWSEAGMMAREDLTPGGRFASVLATPTISGAYFQARSVTNGATTTTGSFPVNYPNTWLRLKRTGNVLTGFASFDGQNWAQLGAVNPGTCPAHEVLFDYVVQVFFSHNTDQTCHCGVPRLCRRHATVGTNAHPEPLRRWASAVAAPAW